MNIVLLTNTFTPHVGGVARSVEAFTAEYRKRGHRVLVVAPEFPNQPENERDVFRIPAIQNFNASDFSVALPFPTGLTEILDDFRPDIIHSQHPFLLGMTAVRIARYRKLPLVFTHHTLYEQYTHYVPGDSPALKRFVIELATRYGNLSDQIFAPSESIRDLLHERGVSTPILVVPTGVRVENFSAGDGKGFRAGRDIPGDVRVIGHVGRLAPEKNLAFMTDAIIDVMKVEDNVHCVIAGKGPSEKGIRESFRAAGLEARLHLVGMLGGRDLADALNAMNVFVFASKSETQGMVLTEAMAAGLPVVALDAPGAREVVRDQKNGRLVMDESRSAFADALRWAINQPPETVGDLQRTAQDTAEAFSMERSAEKALACYEQLTPDTGAGTRAQEKGWEQVMTRIKVEWDILKSVTKAGDGIFNEKRAPGE